MEVTVREARPDDAAAVAAFTADTWSAFEGGDYLPEVFPEWVASDDPHHHTLVAEGEGDTGDDGAGAGEAPVVGCCRVGLLSAGEAWTQGMRVHPDHRGRGVARALDRACREWARDRGARVVRNMVFSWNEQGLAAARNLGYRPCCEFRWARPDPVATDADAAAAATDGPTSAGPDSDAAWECWRASDAREVLAGLALDPAESWALSTWTRSRTRWAAGEGRLLAVGDGPAGVAWRTRVTDGDEREAVYGGAAWDDLATARALFDAIRRDAAAVDAETVRVLVPETARHVSDVAAAGVALGDHPDVVLAADPGAD